MAEYNAKDDWRLLISAARHTIRASLPDNEHMDVLTIQTMGLALNYGCRAGFALRHARRAVDIALLLPSERGCSLGFRNRDNYDRELRIRLYWILCEDSPVESLPVGDAMEA
jgi:hypothetical protein